MTTKTSPRKTAKAKAASAAAFKAWATRRKQARAASRAKKS